MAQTDPDPELGPGEAPDPVSALATSVRALPPRCGPVRLAAVDGHAGSGKTTFAARLAAELGDVPVLHLDDLACHEDFFGWPERLRDQVLAPLCRGRIARAQAYDWVRGDFTSRAPATVPPEPVVLVEGVGSGRRALRPYLSCLVWMDVPAPEAWRRGLRRDGAALRGFWDAWTRAESAHFRGDPSFPYAHYLVRAGRRGYEVHAGPVGSC